MCKCKAIIFTFTFMGSVCLIVILSNIRPLMKLIDDRKLFREKQFQLCDDWAKQPLKQKQKFYLFNITNGDRFLWSDIPMTVDEIGPFVYDSVDSNETVRYNGYNQSSLSFEDLRFNSSESDEDESVFIYALNVPLIRRLSSKAHSLLKPPDEDLVHKTTVRDALRDIVDGRDLSTVELFPADEAFKELSQDASSNYLHFLRNEICVRLSRVVRFVNPPTRAESGRFFRSLPCDCLIIVPNGTEGLDRRRWIAIVAFDNPERAGTKNYLLLWDNESCAGSSVNFSHPIPPLGNLSERVFSVSSAAYWRNESYVRYHSKSEHLSETRIKIELFSDVITDFSFEYQFNIPIKFPEERVNNYPVFRLVTSGVSNEDVNSSINRFIVYPSLITETYEFYAIFCASCLFIVFCCCVILWAWHIIRRNNAQQTEQ